jgi:hypothetical protein
MSSCCPENRVQLTAQGVFVIPFRPQGAYIPQRTDTLLCWGPANSVQTMRKPDHPDSLGHSSGTMMRHLGDTKRHTM